MYDIGDSVRITNEKRIYDLYRKMAEIMKLPNWCEGNEDKDGKVGMIVACHPHPDRHVPLYGVRLHDGAEIIIGTDGMELISKKSTLDEDLFEI